MEKITENKEAKKVYKNYNTTKANELYKICFEYHKVMYIYTTEELPTSQLYIKNRDNKKYIQLRLNKEYKEYILNNEQDKIQVLCTKKEYEQKKKQYSKKYNKTFNNGTIFEVLCKHLYNQRYTGHDTTPYNIAGDIQVNGIEIQLKFQNAQVVAFDTVKRVMNSI